MKKKSTTKTKNKYPTITTVFTIVVITASILLIPYIAMQFTDEVDWSTSDFVVAGGLVAGTALFYELIKRNASSVQNRVIATIVLLAAALLIWLELAVGIFS